MPPANLHEDPETAVVFHVSDNGVISRFAPRPVRPGHPMGIREPVVWAIGGRLLHNYLLPRDCPRVCYHAGTQTTSADRERFFDQTTAQFVIAIESDWLPAVLAARLYCYELPQDDFQLVDAVADYWISYRSVIPRAVRAIDNPIIELAKRPVELRIVPSLWPLYDAVAASTLSFSMIRMANAALR